GESLPASLFRLGHLGLVGGLGFLQPGRGLGDRLVLLLFLGGRLPLLLELLAGELLGRFSRLAVGLGLLLRLLLRELVGLLLLFSGLPGGALGVLALLLLLLRELLAFLLGHLR